MRTPKSLFILFLSFTIVSCWDSYQIGRDDKKEVPKKIDSTKIDSNILERPRPKPEKPKNNKALDSLKPSLAMSESL